MNPMRWLMAEVWRVKRRWQIATGPHDVTFWHYVTTGEVDEYRNPWTH